MKPLVLRCVAVVLLMAGHARLQAEVVWPDYSDLHVNDYIGLLDEATATTLGEQLRQLRQHTGVEMTVVIIERRSDHGFRGPIEPFATGLFNHWGVGSAERNDGVMLLVSRSDRDVRIELGAGYPGSADRQARRVIDETLLPRFRQGDFDQGIAEGVVALIGLVRGGQLGRSAAAPQTDQDSITDASDRFDRPSAQDQDFSTHAAADNHAPISASDSGIPGWLLALAGVPGIGFVVFYIRRHLRRKPRPCSNCHTLMVRLDELAEDDYLEEAKELEERIRSVDYDVWQCPSCEHMTISRYPAWFSSYGACRQCNYRTVESDTTTVRSATYSSTGRKRIDYVCLNCQHHYQEYRTIPMKTRSSSSSSSSSSSFGGGSSSGGGASGSW